MNRRNRSSLAANPVLIGAVTTLVVVVAVFLAYNANNGLPFVPVYEIDVVVPDAAELVPGNEVRIGGSRVGVVTDIEADLDAAPGANSAARLSVSIETAAQPLPADSRATVRQRSNLGLKYLEIVPGSAAQDIPEGGEIPLEQSNRVVSFDEAISVFDEDTRGDLKGVARDLGSGLAGRGSDINRLLDDLPPVMSDLRAVASSLSSSVTDLQGFLRGARSATAAISPVSGQLGSLFAAGARTFEALGAESEAIERTLEVAPESQRRAAVALREARPLFAETAALLRDARPAVDILEPTANRLTAGLRAATPVLERTPPFAEGTGTVLRELEELSERPALTPALRHLTATVKSLDSALQVIAPFQVQCNYLGLWGRNVPAVISEGDTMGTWFRFIPIVGNLQEITQSAHASPTLHANPVADTGAGGECEPGNEVYIPNEQVIGPAPGEQPLATEPTPRPPTVGGTR